MRITAKEAKRMATATKKDTLSRICVKIAKAASKHRYSCSIKYKVSEQDREWLINNNFEVKDETSAMEGNYLEITWCDVSL